MTDDTGDLKARLRAYIEGSDFVSFAELCQNFREIDDRDGGYNLMVPGFENICIWTGLSEAASNAFIELFEERVIHPVPCRTLIYMFDGIYPNLPVVTKPPGKRGLKTLHWHPVTLRPGPPPKTKTRKPAKAGAA